MRESRSIHKFFKSQAIRWSMIGFVLTGAFALVYLVYTAKVSSEQHADLLAATTAKAFRPMLINGYVRETQLQMHNALKLKAGEFVVVRDENLKVIHSINSDIPELSACSPKMEFCWTKDFKYIEYLFPIYFDEQETQLFGYLDLKLRTSIDYNLLAFTALLMGLAFFIQALGLSRALSRSANQVTSQLSKWAGYLKDRKASSIEPLPQVPFVELNVMQEAVNTLNQEILDLQKAAAAEAKASGQLSILREIGHELKTPLSQLAKLFTVLTTQARAGEKPNEMVVDAIERSLSRMGHLVRQTRALYYKTPNAPESCDLREETQKLVTDLAFDPEISQKRVKVELIDSVPGKSQRAHVSPVAYYRMLENLLRNAVHAVDAQGEVTISLATRKGSPTLFVKDNGPGIPEDVQARMFDFDFSTKPGRGTGMGLGIVKKLCSEFGAKLDYISELEKGTEFYISFLPDETSNKTRSDVV